MMYWVSKIVIVIVIIVLCSVVSRKTAFSVDWLHQTTLHILHGAENFNSITMAYNDYFNDR